MKPVVRYPIFDLENHLLVSEGTELTPDFLEDFRTRKRRSSPSVPMLHYGNIEKDLLQQFATPPYNVIFADEQSKAKVLGIMANISLPLPIFQVMNYFREHDYHTYRHMLIISALTTLILDYLDPQRALQGEEYSHLGPLHDLGKFTVPLAILRKNTPLTIRELDLLRHHTVAGYVLVSHYLNDHNGLSSLIALDHHERRDGTGYSRGIVQDNLAVEVTAVCDIYDALIAERPYRPVSYDNRTAIEELTLMARNGVISWRPVQVLIAYNRRMRTDVEAITISMERRGSPPRHNVYGMLADEERGGREAQVSN